MAPAQPTPWSEHREHAERVGHAVAEALSARLGTMVDLGVASACDTNDLVVGRPLPLHAIVVRFERPLRDAMIFVSSLKEDVVRPLVEAAAAATLVAAGVPTEPDAHGPLGRFVVEDAVELDTVEEALEQCDALYLEATYTLELPTGELQMVLGSGLLESIAHLAAGTADPFAEGTPWARAEAAEDPARYEVGEGDLATDAGELATEPVVAPAAASPLELMDAMLEEQELVAPAGPTAAALAAAAEATDEVAFAAASSRWTELLSGVEVELSAELGRAELALHEITSLDSASVLTLDQMVEQPVTVFVNGTPYATARLVVVDGEYGIEIIEVFDQVALVNTLAA